MGFKPYGAEPHSQLSSSREREGAAAQGQNALILRSSTQSSKVVLVVEDNQDDIALVQIGASNAQCPFEFKFVGNGEEALAYLEGTGVYFDRTAHPLPDLIVLDLNMPRRNGFEVLKWIRTRLQFDRIQVIVWTGWEHAGIADRARQAGANLFLRKPEEASGWITFIGMVSLALNGLHQQSEPGERGLVEPAMEPVTVNGSVPLASEIR